MKTTRWVFLALALLASIQVLWWAYLVILQQNTIADLLGTVEALQKADAYKTMIIFEGVFFVFVWSLGVWYAYSSIKDQIRLQEERRSFLSAITHELKTPLSTIQLSLETIAKPQVTEEQRRSFISRSLLACTKLFNEIETILTFNESERMTRKENFRALDLLNEVKKDTNVTVAFDVQLDQDSMTYANFLESKAILKNIIDNAVKYSQKMAAPEVAVLATNDKNKIKITVKDNGIGLDPSEIEKVFSPFWRGTNAKELALEGSGLGLTLSAKLAKKNKVGIRLHSSGINQGTQVLLEWPRTEVSANG